MELLLVRVRTDLECFLPDHAQQPLEPGSPRALGTNVYKRIKLATKRPSFFWPQVGADADMN